MLSIKHSIGNDWQFVNFRTCQIVNISFISCCLWLCVLARELHTHRFQISLQCNVTLRIIENNLLFNIVYILIVNATILTTSTSQDLESI